MESYNITRHKSSISEKSRQLTICLVILNSIEALLCIAGISESCQVNLLLGSLSLWFVLQIKQRDHSLSVVCCYEVTYGYKAHELKCHFYARSK